MKTPPSPRDPRSGQTLIFMALVIVMIAFAALFYFDVHKVLHVKGISRNAGDAAALSGARWQAISLNLVGSLNLAQALAIAESLAAGQTESPEAMLIADLQRRIAFTGPLFGFLAAQQVAKNNGIHNQEEFARSLRAHADNVERDYTRFYPEPFRPMPPMTSAWLEYADMLRLVADHGVAVHASWRFFRNYSHMNHLLLNPAFYDAVAGSSWCWFYHNAYTELSSYSSYLDWDPLPGITVDPPVNSEVFSLLLRRVRVLDDVRISATDNAGTWARLIESLTDRTIPPEVAEFESDWAFYNPGHWGSWSARIPSDFPWDSGIRSQYDYAGADAAVRVMAETERHTNFQGADTINWTAAAKPFGMLEGSIPPNRHGLVLPAYTDVRLIPIDTSVSGGNGQLRSGWLEWIFIYLPQYLEFGPGVLPSGNWYANQVLQWERFSFRRAGVEWLMDHSARCNQPPPSGGGGGGSGGTYHGH